MNFQEPRIKNFMTLQPQTIEGKENVETARKMMVRFDIRHLPVMSDGEVVGILSERELNLAAGIESIDPKHLFVIDVCSQKPYIVDLETPLREVAGTMAKKHFGSAIVTENSSLIGIFTAVDACQALRDLLEEAFEEGIQNSRFFLRPDRRVNGENANKLKSC